MALTRTPDHIRLGVDLRGGDHQGVISAQHGEGKRKGRIVVVLVALMRR